jgi:lactoylglutathione lyase
MHSRPIDCGAKSGIRLMTVSKFNEAIVATETAQNKDGLGATHIRMTDVEALRWLEDLFSIKATAKRLDTEKDDSFKHYNGNEEGRNGFGHIGFLVDDVYKACDAIEKMGYGFRKTPDGGSMKGLAFAYDPDGYSVEIIRRGGTDSGDTKVAA